MTSYHRISVCYVSIKSMSTNFISSYVHKITQQILCYVTKSLSMFNAHNVLGGAPPQKKKKKKKNKGRGGEKIKI